MRIIILFDNSADKKDVCTLKKKKETFEELNLYIFYKFATFESREFLLFR